ncbi:hypothetical protein OUZ56_017013 [Daphnia magna]|uniref:Uncharacterized protein n=1 Tax=Daphnia magna TaxID=35525 RepID=A0ABR0ARX8_9CRUS|nr:hypothetical protein OUZ56_017013 [Daphnia magna]
MKNKLIFNLVMKFCSKPETNTGLGLGPVFLNYGLGQSIMDYLNMGLFWTSATNFFPPLFPFAPVPPGSKQVTGKLLESIITDE